VQDDKVKVMLCRRLSMFEPCAKRSSRHPFISLQRARDDHARTREQLADLMHA
jgi:hypothetical protein